MFYRVQMTLAFPERKEAEKSIEKALDIIGYAVVIHPGEINEERGFILIEKCYHDEDPPKPCEVVYRKLVED